MGKGKKLYENNTSLIDHSNIDIDLILTLEKEKYIIRNDRINLVIEKRNIHKQIYNKTQELNKIENQISEKIAKILIKDKKKKNYYKHIQNERN